MSHPARCLVVDLDGVLRTFAAQLEAADAAGQAVGVTGRAVAEIAFRTDLLEAAVTGRSTDEQWREAVQAELTKHHPGAEVSGVVAVWWGPGSVDQDVATLVAEVRRRVPVVLLTNATTRLEADLCRLGLERAFDAVVNTSRVGKAKPDPEAFRAAHEAAAAALGDPDLRAQSLLFVDDSPTNVDAAVRLGWQGHRFTTAARLRERLVEAELVSRCPAPRVAPAGG